MVKIFQSHSLYHIENIAYMLHKCMYVNVRIYNWGWGKDLNPLVATIEK